MEFYRPTKKKSILSIIISIIFFSFVIVNVLQGNLPVLLIYFVILAVFTIIRSLIGTKIDKQRPYLIIDEERISYRNVGSLKDKYIDFNEIDKYCEIYPDSYRFKTIKRKKISIPVINEEVRDELLKIVKKLELEIR